MSMEQMQTIVTVQVMAVMVEGRVVILVQFSWGIYSMTDRAVLEIDIRKITD